MEISKKRKELGQAPGSIVFTGQKKVAKPHLHILSYAEGVLENEEPDTDKHIPFPKVQPGCVKWIDLRGLHNEALIGRIGERFNLHPLIMEGIANTQQRPKLEEYENGIFIILKALSYSQSTRRIKMEQVSIFLGDSFVISFQEDSTDLFETVRLRIEAGKTRIRKLGADYLTFALLDLITDHYFVVMDEIEGSIEKMETEVLTNPTEESKAKIHRLKRQMIRIRKSINPLREAISRFYRLESDFLQDGTKIYLRDLYDHTITIMDLVESYRDTLTGLQDLYLSELSFRMNKIMQLLTIISTIFIPLGFLAGLYGMNFVNIPELQNENGYFYLLGVMGTMFVLFLIYFKIKKWF